MVGGFLLRVFCSLILIQDVENKNSSISRGEIRVKCVVLLMNGKKLNILNGKS